MDIRRKALKTVFNITHIINILYYKFPKNFVFDGETHDFWEFIYVDKGEVVITAGDFQYILKAGEMAFHRPNEFHDVRANGSVSPNVIVISFVCNSTCMKFFERRILFLNEYEKECLSDAMSESEMTYYPIEVTPPVFRMAKRKNIPFGAEQLIKGSVERMLIHIYRQQDSIHIRQRALCVNTNHNYKEIAETVKTLLEDNMQKKITLTWISDRIGVSISQIKKIFKQQTGHSVIEYLTRMRIDEAKRLIQQGNYNFSQITEIVGYDNIHYFSKVFKEKTEMTLTEYSLSIQQ